MASGLVGFAFFILEGVFQFFTKEYGLLVPAVVALFGAVMFLAILQFATYWGLSKGLKRTLVHYGKLVIAVSPLLWLSLVVTLFYLLSVFGLCAHLDLLKARVTITVFLAFCLAGVALGLWSWLGPSFWYRPWTIRRGKTVVDVLASRSGLSAWEGWGDRDKIVRRALFGLRDCHFILVWGINFNAILGRDNPQAVEGIQKLLNHNSKAAIFVLLHCPFCEEVIERCAELDVAYDARYTEASQTSVANCYAVRSKQVRVGLAHGEPYLRSILWGRFVDSSSVGPLDVLGPVMDIFEPRQQRYIRHVEWGGFMVQEYPRGERGSLSPLYQGSTLLHGGMWNAIREKFADEFEGAVKPLEGLHAANVRTLRHLARDLGLTKKKAEDKNTTKEDLCVFISRDPAFTAYIGGIKMLAGIELNLLPTDEGGQTSE